MVALDLPAGGSGYAYPGHLWEYRPVPGLATEPEHLYYRGRYCAFPRLDAGEQIRLSWTAGKGFRASSMGSRGRFSRSSCTVR